MKKVVPTPKRTTIAAELEQTWTYADCTPRVDAPRLKKKASKPGAAENRPYVHITYRRGKKGNVHGRLALP